jgi:hypothetical protein
MEAQRKGENTGLITDLICRGVTPEHLARRRRQSYLFPFAHGLAQARQLGHPEGISLYGYDDPNFDPTATLLEDGSPYPEVWSAIANTDDPAMSSSIFLRLGRRSHFCYPCLWCQSRFPPFIGISPVCLQWSLEPFSHPAYGPLE